LFDRFTEKARRVIFFARYEASVFGQPYIGTEHLLLGLMRQDMQLKSELRARGGTDEKLRARIQSQSPAGEKISTTVDLPLSRECQRALSYAAEESEELNHKIIGPGHLVLGLLRIDDCLATKLLNEYGIGLGNYRDWVRETPPEAPGPPQDVVTFEPPDPRAPKSAQLAAPIAALARLIDLQLNHLNSFQRLKRKPWTRSEAMGRLIDLATTHHQWLARALSEPRLAAPQYPQEGWVAAQQYGEYPWPELVNLWISLNRLLMHVLAVVPEEKLKLECRLGIEEPQTLLALIWRYVRECEDLIGQVLAKLD